MLHMRLSMAIDVELLAVLEFKCQILRHVSSMLLNGERMLVREVNPHLLVCDAYFELEPKSLGKEVQIIAHLNHMMLIIQRNKNAKITSLQIAGIVLRQCVHHVEWFLHGPNLPNQNHLQIFWAGCRRFILFQKVALHMFALTKHVRL